MTAKRTTLRLGEDETLVTTRVEVVPYLADAKTEDRVAVRLILHKVVPNRGYDDHTLKVTMRKDGSVMLNEDDELTDHGYCYVPADQLADLVAILTDQLCYLQTAFLKPNNEEQAHA